jgi:tetratricopeptide (TPR) repeat protein
MTYACSTRILIATLGLLPAANAIADPVSRTPAISGQVVQTRTGEDISFVENASQQALEVRQDVKAGDVIRTNASGQIALLFTDRTQIRLGRNSELLVKEVRSDGGVTLNLKTGQLFGRAARGGAGVTVDTPAAAAAIRGTDWTLNVQGPRTTLSVIEGLVDLRNPHGEVSVAAGESAAATIGSAPSKIVIVGGDLREQMMYNLTLRNAFSNAHLPGHEVKRLQQEEQRLATVATKRRSPADWVAAAEVAYAREGRAAAAQAIERARSMRLDARYKARLDLLEGRLAAEGRRYAEAARLFEWAKPHLKGDQQVAAGYYAYFARSLADPKTVYPRPVAQRSSLASVLGEETIVAFLESPKKALEVLRASEARFGGDVRYQAAIANRALLASDFAAAEAAIRKGEQIDANDAALLDARASYRSYVQGDVKGALSDQQKALRRDPANMEYWNNLALLESGRGAYREAEAAYLQAIALDPDAPEPLANYAALLLNSGRNGEAKAMIDKALAVDPGFDVALFQRGRLRLQSGESDGGLEDMLKATAANPTYGKGLLTLGAAYAARGEMDPASQSFEIADQLDPLAPAAVQYRALLSLDQYLMDDAIRFARESVRRTRARGGNFTSVAASDDFGSTLGGIYRTAGLEAWGRYWSDRTFDPFQGASYFDQNLNGSVRPYYSAPGAVAIGEPNTGDDASYSGYVQGLMLDPLAIASPRMHASFFRVPFQETELGVGVTSTGRDIGFNTFGSYQRLGYDPLPYAFSADLTSSFMNPSYADQDAKNLNLSTTFGIQVTPDDRLVGHLNFVHQEGGVSYGGAISDGLDVTRGDRLNADGFNGFLGWSHTFAYQNVLNVGVFGSVIDRSGRESLFDYGGGPPPLGADVDVDESHHSLKGGISHLFEPIDNITIRYGVEGGHTDSAIKGATTIYELADPTNIFGVFPGVPVEVKGDNARAWLGATWEATPTLKFEADLFGNWVRQNGDEETSFDPRFGIAWEPIEGQYLRAAFVKQAPLGDLNTLAPIAIVGLRADHPQDGSGPTETTIVRWDSEWSERLFTSVEYQHQEVENLSLTLPVYSYGLGFPKAELDRLSFTANLWIGGGLSAFANYTRVWAESETAGFEHRLPLIPEHAGRIGLNYVSPQRVNLFVAETYLGERLSYTPDVIGLADLAELDDAFVTDIGASWESEDRHFSASVTLSNVFDADVDVAPLVPGQGRTLRATISSRF